jgi:hypothetical protein
MIDLTTDEQMQGPEFDFQGRLVFFSTHTWDDVTITQNWQGFTLEEALAAAIDFHRSLPFDERENFFRFSMRDVILLED